MRETLEQAAKKLLTEPEGTERTISIDTNDGLTGFPPGGAARDRRTKDHVVKVEAQVRADGKKRTTVVATAKGKVLAATEWK